MKTNQVKERFPWPDHFPLKHGKWCRKSQKHWQEKARRLFADCLVRAAMVDTRGPVGAMVEKRILALLEAEDSEMLAEIASERDRCIATLVQFRLSLLPDPPRKPRSHRRKEK